MPFGLFENPKSFASFVRKSVNPDVVPAKEETGGSIIEDQPRKQQLCRHGRRLCRLGSERFLECFSNGSPPLRRGIGKDAAGKKGRKDSG